MNEEFPPQFQAAYQTHLQRLRLTGFRPKTIEAYSLGVRRAARYFNYQIDELCETQLTHYFSQLLTTHSWSTLKHDLYGLQFYYSKVLHKDWPAPMLIKAPTSQRLPDIVTIEQMQHIIVHTKEESKVRKPPEKRRRFRPQLPLTKVKPATFHRTM